MWVIALETTAYSSRKDFLERLQSLLDLSNESFKPKIVERFGLRYINRLTGQNAVNISSLVKPEIAGITASNFKEYIRQTINESLFIIPDGDEQIIARWGLIPEGMTFDPDALEPIAEPSWVLDLDMSLTKNREFSVDRQIDDAQRFSERIYTFFRWAVQDDFLRHFGGEL